jgi:hypothetical protein
MKPFKYDPDGVPVFSNLDIDDYGFPELYGFESYRVVESREAVMVTDYKQEREYDIRTKHRYSRLARFKVCLLNILGERGGIQKHVLQMVRIYLKPESKDKWNDTRKLLKHFKQRKYYDQIPFILKSLSFGRAFPQLTGDQLDAIITDFKCLSDRFDRQKCDYERRYFPNIRFIVLKLLELHGIKPNYPVPFVRTSRKLKSLHCLWDLLLIN